RQLLQGNACTTNKIRQPAIASKPAPAVIGAPRNYVNNLLKALSTNRDDFLRPLSDQSVFIANTMTSRVDIRHGCGVIR
ncbi:hypothetical protein, partial [Pseudomonas sp. GM33]|uniref:hypothetical protein n=1 Tax=Pseudomonas sp. GM33 TaxID=1144329 RepID=UPI001EE63EA5